MTPPPSWSRSARLAGALYLLIIAGGLFSEVGVRAALVVPGDPAATAGGILGSSALFRTGFAIDVLVFVADVWVAALLYGVFRSVGRTASATAAAFRLTGTAVYGANLLHQLAALRLLEGPWAASLQPGAAQGLAGFFMDLHAHGYDLGLVFFGAHCAALAWLLWRSGGRLRGLGLLMALAGAGYWIGSFTRFLAPDRVAAVTPIYALPLLGEVAFTIWLLAGGRGSVPPGHHAPEAVTDGDRGAIPSP